MLAIPAIKSANHPPPIPAIIDEKQRSGSLNPIRCEDSPAVPGAKERAAWSITQACMASICNKLQISDWIDHDAIEILLASMEKSEKKSGYSFDSWRTAVKIVAAEAKRFESQDIAQLTEAIMSERERVLTEAAMSLNDERIRLSKTEKAIRDRTAAKRAIAAEIEGIEREICCLQEQLILKEREMWDRKRDLEEADEECDCLQRNLEDIKEAVRKREETVRVAEAALDSVEDDARAERDRRKTSLRLSIAHLQGFQLGHPALP